MPAKVDLEKCEGCKECVETCATGCIEMVDDKAVVKEEECCECAACIDSCQSSALSME
ncbi:MAG: hypothetical protein WD042_00690 [Phycisphaeraceae bacterium]